MLESEVAERKLAAATSHSGRSCEHAIVRALLNYVSKIKRNFKSQLYLLIGSS